MCRSPAASRRLPARSGSTRSTGRDVSPSSRGWSTPTRNRCETAAGLDVPPPHRHTSRPPVRLSQLARPLSTPIVCRCRCRQPCGARRCFTVRSRLRTSSPRSCPTRAPRSLAHGLAALDDETLRFLAEHPAVVTRLYERDAAVFAAFAAHLQIRDNRVVPPGGDRAVPLWEALLNEKVAHPEGFVRELFARDKGRIAYLYDIIGHLDSSRAAFALGLWIDDARRARRPLQGARVGDIQTRSASGTSRDFRSRGRRTTFCRCSRASRWRQRGARIPRMAIGVGARDWPTATCRRSRPGVRRAWTTSGSSTRHGSPRCSLRATLAGGPTASISLPSASVCSPERRPRKCPTLIVAIQAFPRFRMLMLTLERIGVRRPALYAALARQAQRVSSLDEVRARPALAQFQGAIALIARLARVKTIDRATADALLGTLAAPAVRSRHADTSARSRRGCSSSSGLRLRAANRTAASKMCCWRRSPARPARFRRGRCRGRASSICSTS